MQHTHAHTTPAALASEMSSVWDRRATARPIAEGSDRLLVNILDPHHDTLSQVCEWLAKRWEVLWVEGKPRNKPMVREAVKLVTHETRAGSDAEIAVRAGVLLSKDEVCMRHRALRAVLYAFVCMHDCVHECLHVGVFSATHG
jgi:hypothetical protein